jgi:hypothetical protein
VEEIKQSVMQTSKKVFSSQRKKGERSSPQRRQVVALRAKVYQILARSAKILVLRALNRSPFFLCEENTFLIACLSDRGKLTHVACAAENLRSVERPSAMTITATRPEGHSFRPRYQYGYDMA